MKLRIGGKEKIERERKAETGRVLVHLILNGVSACSGARVLV